MSHVEYGSGNGAQSAPRNTMLLRLAYTLGFGVLAWALLWFSFALTILQLIVTVVAGQRNPQLAEFGRRLGSWMREILRYMTGDTDIKPFPLAPFPTA
jgi:hypothetical protein